jgi:general secretion pathway protein G
VMREAIDQFTMDMNAAPQNLDDLRKANYLPTLPEDPFTHSTDWATEKCETLTRSNQIVTGIYDVHSTAPGTSSFEGTPYRSW